MIRLKRFDSSCYKKLISWIDTPELLMQFAGSALTFPLTKQQLDQSLNDPNRFSFKVVDAAGEMIGVAEIYLGSSTAYLARILIGEEQLRGQGLGQMVVSQLLHYAFQVLQQPKVELNVFDWNVSAIRCYEKLGFRVNPLKKAQRTVNGQTWTAINMTVSRSCWEQSQEH